MVSVRRSTATITVIGIIAVCQRREYPAIPVPILADSPAAAPPPPSQWGSSLPILPLPHHRHHRNGNIGNIPPYPRIPEHSSGARRRYCVILPEVVPPAAVGVVGAENTLLCMV
ncbi:hypothetical protein DFH09DRAFT_1339663 [Mycena vulgaris]|nr:hypothetical protein DFH09DRAFT_1339663 [Mycena vulgaris]